MNFLSEEMSIFSKLKQQLYNSYYSAVSGQIYEFTKMWQLIEQLTRQMKTEMKSYYRQRQRAVAYKPWPVFIMFSFGIVRGIFPGLRHGCPSFVDIQRGLKVSRRHFEKSTISVIKNALKQSLVYIVSKQGRKVGKNLRSNFSASNRA